MSNTTQQLLDLLHTIQGNGSFVTAGKKKFIPPGLHIEGLGEVGFPLNKAQAKEIIQLAGRAPYGKGSRTITDTSVRSAWEIDAGKVSFRNKDWEAFLNKILKKVKEGLGIEEQSVTASLYKLLVYEKGDFFLPHKDSEKEPGMFGTLVVALPSEHTGGELLVRFDGREETIDFSEAASDYKIPYTAFFADCDHEIKPITSGYRIALAYNLVQAKGGQKIGGHTFSAQVGQLVPLLQSLAGTYENKPKAILLDHQYTPANFSLSQLKHHDRPRAEALMEAAEKAGYFAGLGLVTHYVMGDLEGDDYDYGYGYSRRYREPEPAGMGDVHETYTQIEHWSGEGTPTLGTIRMTEDDLLTDIEVGEGDPIEQEEEGYTGNAGMTMEYWYHYGAVVIWPRDKHAQLLTATPVSVRLQWLSFYHDRWEDGALQSKDYARQLLEGFSPEDLEEKYDRYDFSPIAAVLIKMKDEKFQLKRGLPLLEAGFDKIKTEAWTGLLRQYKPAHFAPVFRQASGIRQVNHLLEVLKSLAGEKTPALKDFMLKQLRQLPDLLKETKLSKLENSAYHYGGLNEPTRKEKIGNIVRNTLWLSQFMEKDVEWITDASQSLTKPLPRDYANEVLAAILLDNEHHDGLLAYALRQVLAKDLAKRTKVKPTPPPDWSRPVPDTKNDQGLWDILRPFLESPTETVFEYRKSEAYRQQMAAAIGRVTVDLKMETVKKGSPYTLKLTKTQAAYKKALKEWEEDVGILERLEKRMDG